MNSEQEKNSLFEEDAFKPVPPGERHGWWKTSFIWAGSSICVPTIMVGALMIKGLSFMEMILAVIIGTVLLSIVFCLQGMEGTDTGLPTVVLARSAFGREGAGIIISFILATTLICWTGSDCQIAGESFIQILTLNNIHWNREATIIILGIIMLTVSILGEKIISKLNIISRSRAYSALYIRHCYMSAGHILSGSGQILPGGACQSCGGSRYGIRHAGGRQYDLA